MNEACLSQEETKALNAAVFEKLGSYDPVLQKEAVDAINDFTRFQVREDSFYDRILPPVTITSDEFDRVVETDQPVKVIDKEPGSPAAVSVPFATLPTGVYIRGPRYKVTFDRILTPRFSKDVAELATWVMDIRQVLSDNAVKDMSTEKDTKFISAVNTSMVGLGVTVPTSGVVQYQSISGGITRESIMDGLKILPQTPSNLEVQTTLVNHITIKDFAKWGRNEMGGDLALDTIRNGFSEQTFAGTRMLATIKRTLVPNSHAFYFADPKFTGKHYEWEPPTMYVKREAYMIDFFSYLCEGGAIGNTNSVARARFV